MPKRCLVKKGHFLLVIKEGVPSNYRVDFERCDTPAKVLDWVYHLAHKQWVTKELLIELIDAAAQQHRFDVHCGA